MKLRKAASLALAGALALSLSVPVFAYNRDDHINDYVYAGDHEVTVTALLSEPVIRVQAPTDMQMILNPYGLSYTATNINNEATSTDQIIAPVQYSVNYSSTDIKVSVSAYAEPDPAMTNPKSEAVITGSDATALTTKSVFLFMEAAVRDFGAEANAVDTTFGTAYNPRSTTQAVVGSKKTAPGKLTNAVTMKAGTDDGSGTGFTPGSGSVCAVKLNGSCATAPTKDWSASDQIVVHMTYTFTPTKAAS